MKTLDYLFTLGVGGLIALKIGNKILLKTFFAGSPEDKVQKIARSLNLK
jgi:hypothetical protein